MEWGILSKEAEYTSSHKIFIKIEHILGHKISLDKF